MGITGLERPCRIEWVFASLIRLASG
jgi:hypothetical protein